ncbi:lipase family protein [Accumulibacter sp.]|uniref:lipase family protein n=1 Tax=Accumulibacter sp. TaxID=2053492 RepID=UPI0038FBF58B
MVRTTARQWHPRPGERFTVTGYSLGGHLATVFNFLRKEEAEALGSVNSIAATYTFNGAGAGDVLHGRRLTNVIADFARLRDNASGLVSATEVN